MGEYESTCNEKDGSIAPEWPSVEPLQPPAHLLAVLWVPDQTLEVDLEFGFGLGRGWLTGPTGALGVFADHRFLALDCRVSVIGDDVQNEAAIWRAAGEIVAFSGRRNRENKDLPQRHRGTENQKVSHH